MLDLAVVKDLADHMMTNAPISTEPAQAKFAPNGKGKRKASAPLAKDQTESDKDVMQLTFELQNFESFLTHIGTVVEPNGTIKYIYKKLDKKSKVDPSAQADPTSTQAAIDPSTTQAATDPSTTQAAIDPSTTQAATGPSTTQAATDLSTTQAATDPFTTQAATDPSTTQAATDSNTEDVDIAQCIEDFKKKIMENIDDNELLQIMCHNFFCILTNMVAKKPISGSLSLGGKLNAIQVMANAMRVKEDTQTDKEAMLSYLNSRCSAKNYLKRALKMKEDNTKSVEDLLDMFLDKLKE